MRKDSVKAALFTGAVLTLVDVIVEKVSYWLPESEEYAVYLCR